MAAVAEFPDGIGRYRVIGVLGTGGFATVYHAHDDALDVPVAVKVLAEQWSLDPEVRSRFIQEARLLRRAGSDRLIAVHDVGQLPDGRPYFVMDYADRGTLDERLEQREDASLPPRAALLIVREVAAALADMHRGGVVHRDVKPSNVLLRSAARAGAGVVPAVGNRQGAPLVADDEQVLLGDFGLAKDLALSSTGLSLPVGTPGYMAPEQTDPAAHVDERTDVYGCSALMVRVLAGQPPPPPWQRAGQWQLPADSAPGLGQVLARGLSADPADRHASIEDWLDAVEAATGQAEASVVEVERVRQAPIPTRTAGRWTPRRIALVALALIVLTAGGVGMALWLGDGAPAEYVDYERVVDDTGALSVEVPVDWGHRVGNGWHPGFNPYFGEVDVGPGLNVAPNAWDWFEDATTPGLFVGASSQVVEEADQTPERLARHFAPTGCREDSTGPFSDERLGLSGLEGTWVCDEGHHWYYAYGSSDDQGYVLIVEVKVVDPRDEAARDRALETVALEGEP